MPMPISVFEYTIIHAPTPEEVVEQVNAKLQDGWELYGDLIVDWQPGNPGNFRCYQPMVKPGHK